MKRFHVVTYLVLSIFLARSGAPAQATLIDFTISQSGPHEHQLQLIRPSLVSEPYPLDFVTDGLLAGSYATIEPGWDGLGADIPGDEFFALLSNTGVALQRVSFPDGFSMLDSGLNPILESDGTFHIFAGEPEGEGLLWHEHLRFVGSGDFGLGHEFLPTFRLMDANGMHSASDTFTLRFVTVPEPTSLLILAVGAAGLAFRRNKSRQQE